MPSLTSQVLYGHYTNQYKVKYHEAAVSSALWYTSKILILDSVMNCFSLYRSIIVIPGWLMQ